jgi:hypothetical protein
MTLRLRKLPTRVDHLTFHLEKEAQSALIIKQGNEQREDLQEEQQQQ